LSETLVEIPEYLFAPRCENCGKPTDLVTDNWRSYTEVKYRLVKDKFELTEESSEDDDDTELACGYCGEDPGNEVVNFFYDHFDVVDEMDKLKDEMDKVKEKLVGDQYEKEKSPN